MATFFALTVAAFLLASCADPQPPSGIPAELREIIEANRAIALPPFHPDFDEIAQGLLTPGLTPEGDLAVREFATASAQPHRALDRNDHLSALLSHERLAEEIHFLFRLLRYGYAGYQYFGGDEVFLPMRDSMLAHLALMEDPLPLFSYLHDILVPNLRTAIADNHFTIHNVRLAPQMLHLRISDEFVLRESRSRRGDSAFYVEIDGARHRVLGTTLRNGAPVDGILPTLTRDGELAHAFGLLAADGDMHARELTALLECASTGERSAVSVSLPQARSYQPESRPFLSTREENGVTIAENRTLSAANAASVLDMFGAFGRLGLSMRGEPAAIMDLRGNLGGSSRFVDEWMQGFTGHVASGFAFTEFALPSAPRRRTPGVTRPGLPPAWEQRPPLHRLPLRNNTLLIVLMDNNTASAGEIFVGNLRELENVLFVGSNTMGALITGYVHTHSLPFSDLDITFGTALHLRPDLSQFEGRGFMPDLWVPPGESLERALAFIERYGLNR